MRRCVSGEACFGFRSPAHGTFIPDLPSRAGGSTRIGCDGCRVIVRFDFHQDVNVLFGVAVAMRCGIENKFLLSETLDHRSVISVGAQYAFAVDASISIANHVEKRLLACLTVNNPVCVEYLVSAVFGVGLRKHHELNIGWVTTQLSITLREIIYFVFGQRESQRDIGLLQCPGAIAQKRNCRKRPWFSRAKHRDQIIFLHEPLRHAVKKMISRAVKILWIHIPTHATFNPQDGRQLTRLKNVGRFARPWRNRPLAWHDSRAELASRDGQIGYGAVT